MFNNTIYHRYYRLLNQAEWNRTDLIQPLCILILSITGIFFIYSTQLYSGGSFWIKQIVWIIIGAFVYTLVSLINYRIFLEKGHWIYGASILLLLLLWTPLGEERNNSRRWLDFGYFLFQSSEAAKIGSLVMVSSILARSEIGSIKDSFKVIAKVTIVILIPILLIFMQPDLGSALIFPPMVFSLLYISKLSERFFAIIFGVFILLIGVLSLDIYKYYTYLQENELSIYESTYQKEGHPLLPLKDYQRNRILAFIAPEAVDPRGIGVSWNQRQSHITVGSGGALGKGWTEGTQAKLGYLPQTVAYTDFIFSVLAEEKGFLGSIFVIGIYVVLVCNGIRIAAMAQDRFGMLLVVGVCVIFMVHIFINVGMTIGLMPITGLPLPFLSYGGSFIISCCILQGLVQSVFRYRRDIS